MALGFGLFFLFPSQVKVSSFQFARFFCYCYSLPTLTRGERAAVWVLGWCLGSAQRSPGGPPLDIPGWLVPRTSQHEGRGKGPWGVSQRWGQHVGTGHGEAGTGPADMGPSPDRSRSRAVLFESLAGSPGRSQPQRTKGPAGAPGPTRGAGTGTAAGSACPRSHWMLRGSGRAGARPRGTSAGSAASGTAIRPPLIPSRPCTL